MIWDKTQSYGRFWNVIIIIIIMSCRQHGYPWPSLATSPYCSSPMAGLQGYIPYPHIATECMFELVVLILLGHMWGSIGVHPLWARPLLLQKWPACLVPQTWIFFVMGDRWPYSWCLLGCCRQDLCNIARSILVYLPSSFFSSRLVSVQVMHSYSSIDTTAAWKKLPFILSVRSDFHMIDRLSIAVHTFVSRVSMSSSVDDTLLPR